MSADDNHDGERRYRRSLTGPAVPPPRLPDAVPSATAVKPSLFRPSFWSIAVFVLIASGVGIRAYRDLSRPDAWDYWKDQYISPSLTVSLIDKTYLDGRDQGRRTLAVSGTIGPAAARLLHDRI